MSYDIGIYVKVEGEPIFAEIAAPEDVRKEIRLRFGFAERDGAIVDHIFGFDAERKEE